MTDAIQTALIASGSAIVGGLLASIGQVILHRLDDAKTLRQIYRDKLEGIAGLVERSNQWVLDMTEAQTKCALIPYGRCSSIRDSYVLACLYFPELRRPIGLYSNNLIRIYAVLSRNFHADGVIASAQSAHDPAYQKLCDEVVSERNELEELIGEVARRYNRKK